MRINDKGVLVVGAPVGIPSGGADGDVLTWDKTAGGPQWRTEPDEVIWKMDGAPADAWSSPDLNLSQYQTIDGYAVCRSHFHIASDNGFFELGCFGNTNNDSGDYSGNHGDSSWYELTSGTGWANGATGGDLCFLHFQADRTYDLSGNVEYKATVELTGSGTYMRMLLLLRSPSFYIGAGAGDRAYARALVTGERV